MSEYAATWQESVFGLHHSDAGLLVCLPLQALGLSPSFYRFIARQVRTAIEGAELLSKLQDDFLERKKGSSASHRSGKTRAGMCGTRISDQGTFPLAYEEQASSAEASRESFFDFLFFVIDEGEREAGAQRSVPTANGAGEALTYNPRNTQPAFLHAAPASGLSSVTSQSADSSGDTPVLGSSPLARSSSSGSSARTSHQQCGQERDCHSSTPAESVSKDSDGIAPAVEASAATAPPFDLLLVASQVRWWLSSVSPSLTPPASSSLSELREAFKRGVAGVGGRQSKQGAVGSSTGKEGPNPCAPGAAVVKAMTAEAMPDTTVDRLPRCSRISGTFSTLIRILAEVSGVSPLSECMKRGRGKQGQGTWSSGQTTAERELCWGSEGKSVSVRASHRSPEFEYEQLLKIPHPTRSSPAGSSRVDATTSEPSTDSEPRLPVPPPDNGWLSTGSCRRTSGVADTSGGRDLPTNLPLLDGGETDSWNSSQQPPVCPCCRASEVQREAAQLAHSLSVLLRFSQQRRLLALMWISQENKSGPPKNARGAQVASAHAGPGSGGRWTEEKQLLATGSPAPAWEPGNEGGGESRTSQTEELNARTGSFPAFGESPFDDAVNPRDGDVEISTLLQGSMVNSVTIRGLSSLLASLPPAGNAAALLRREGRYRCFSSYPSYGLSYFAGRPVPQRR